MSKAEYCVFIGRFQPFHKAHLKIVTNALEEEAERLVIVVGSYRAARSLRNPWTYEERVEMIRAALPPEYLDRVSFAPARDYLYSDLTWLTGIQNAISQEVGDSKNVKIIGHFKDDSSYYLKLFPQWKLVSEPNYFDANATDIREELFSLGEGFFSKGKASFNNFRILPPEVFKHLEGYSKESRFEDLVREQAYLTKYKKRWESAPFPPVFVTTDAVIIQAGHVLLVKRKLNPGKGMFALPGGFLKTGTKIFDSCMEELKEETDIRFPKSELKRALKGDHVFDHPSRDMRGRTITHAFFMQIDRLGPLPTVKGGDDAAEAFWLPVSDLALHEENFFSDHLHIINYFIRSDWR